MYTFLFYFVLFLIYSIIGWIIEMITCAIMDKRWVNRGFLIGPYCPIYGASALIILMFANYIDNISIAFITIILICGIMEYITSFMMEKIFNARWWDYSHKFANINGRVCLSNCLGFGLLGCILIYLLNPILYKYLNNVPSIFIIILGIILLVIFIIDLIISFNIIYKIKGTAEIIRKDYTGEITKKVREVLSTKSILTKRLINAFPNVNLIISKLPKRKK